jgi:gliding motility associated protien GldN
MGGKVMKKIVLIFSVLMLIISSQNNSFSQNNLGKQPLDGVYEKHRDINREPIPYTSLREADVMWSKRIWRVIDMRQKINLPFYYPTDEQKGRKSLMQILYNGIKENTITAYSSGDEEFQTRMTPAELSKSLNKEDTMRLTRNYEPYEEYDTVISQPFNTADIYLLRVKEDWFFDKQRSVMDVRIIGLCPIKEELDENGESKGFRVLFWVYFPECRKLFANNEVYNRWNDAERRTYEDVFFKRLFGSYIYKESNVYDRKIQQYAKGMDGLLEAERIKQELFEKEHDLWEY